MNADVLGKKTHNEIAVFLQQGVFAAVGILVGQVLAAVGKDEKDMHNLHNLVHNLVACCPECGGQMKAVSFIEPPQADVIEAILKHCGLWQAATARAPPEVDDLVLELDAAFAESPVPSADPAGQSHELTYVDIDTL